MSYSYDELKPGVSQYIQKAIGRTLNRNGKWSKVYTGEDYYKTKIGLLSETEWERLADDSVASEGDESLLYAIEAHVRSHCVWLKDKEIHGYSLKCLLSGAYKSWIERGEFSIT